jgi:hypothetical protein
MVIPETTREAIEDALAEFDSNERRATPEAVGKRVATYHYAISYVGRHIQSSGS